MKQIRILLILLAGCSFAVAAKAQDFDEPLKQLIKAAFEHNDTIKINNYRIEQAAVEKQSVKYNYLPKVSANATYTRLNDDIVFPGDLQTLLTGTQRLLIKEGVGLPFNSQLPPTVSLKPVPPIQEKDIFKITGNVQWLLFSGFKVEQASKAITHQQKAMSFLNERQKNKLTLEVSSLYDKLALLYAADSVLDASSKVLQRQNKFVDAAIKNGLATPLDRKRIELAVQKLELKKTENQGSRMLLIEKLHQVTGIDISDLTSLHPNLKPLLGNDNLSPQTRVEIKSLDEAITATRYKEKAEYAEYVPKLAAFSQYEFRDKDLSILEPRWYAGIRLQWNLFDGLNARNNAKKAVLERKIFEQQKSAALELTELGIANAKQQLITAYKRVQMVNVQVQLANESFDMINKQYSNGLTTITELLNALNDVEKARFDYQQAIYEQRRAQLELLEATGNLILNY